MGKRSVAAVVIFTVLIGLLTATPALASYTVSTLLFPEGAATFFSPFSGPATIGIDFNDYQETGANDPNSQFTLRLRFKDGATILNKQVSIAPGSELSPKTFSFDWPALNVTSNTNYEVAVYRGNTQLRERTFLLRPRLLKVTSITPDPFFPTIADGFKDTTRITYDLLASSTSIRVQVLEAAGGGGCCGDVVRDFLQFENRVAGTYGYTWNGRDDGGVLLPEGDYWIQITATAFTGIQGTSVPVHVALDRFYRVTNTASKNGIAYHHRGPTTVLRSGGACALDRLTASSDVRIRCRNARVRVFWRWNLPSGPTITETEITSASFVLIRVPGYTCGATMGHVGNDSFLQVGAIGQRRCRVDKARITYTYIKES